MNRINHFCQSVRSKLTEFLSATTTIIFISAIRLVYGANLWSCVSRLVFTNNENQSSTKLNVIEIDHKNPKHERVAMALDRMWVVLPNTKSSPKLFMVDSSDLNAASFGADRFLFWEGIASLPDWAVDGIVAHEVAHNLLKHSKKAQELNDLTNFFAEVFSLFGGASRGGEQTLKEWMSKAALPKYNRSQEFEADKLAVELLALERYENPRIIIHRTLQILLDRYGNLGGGFFDSHPSTQERIEALKIQDKVANAEGKG